MNWSKYYVSVDEKRSILAAVIGEKIVVRGSVFHAIKAKTPGGSDGITTGAPVVDQPQISCDIHPHGARNSKVETKQFMSDVQGNFEFEINTAAYASGVYSLFVFYSTGEDPDQTMRHSVRFNVFSRQEIDDLKKFIKDKFN